MLELILISSVKGRVFSIMQEIWELEERYSVAQDWIKSVSFSSRSRHAKLRYYIDFIPCSNSFIILEIRLED